MNENVTKIYSLYSLSDEKPIGLYGSIEDCRLNIPSRKKSDRDEIFVIAELQLNSNLYYLDYEELNFSDAENPCLFVFERKDKDV